MWHAIPLMHRYLVGDDRETIIYLYSVSIDDLTAEAGGELDR